MFIYVCHLAVIIYQSLFGFKSNLKANYDMLNIKTTNLDG